jgi:integrase
MEEVLIFFLESFHDLRHSAASRWVMSGVPLAAVAMYLGHSGASMVMRYVHLVPEVNDLAIAGMMSYYKVTGAKPVPAL